MAKKTSKSVVGTSFYYSTVNTTYNKLEFILGSPQISQNTGTEKVNFEWDCVTNTGDVFTIYDWKEYKILDGNENIDFHIGAHDSFISIRAAIEIETLLIPEISISSSYLYEYIETYANTYNYFIIELGSNVVGESFIVLKHNDKDITISFMLESSNSKGFIYKCIYSDLES